MTKITKMNAKMVVMVAYLLLLVQVVLCHQPSMSFMDFSSLRRINQNNRVIITTKSESRWTSISQFHSIFSTLRSHPSPITPPPPPPPPPPPIQLHSPSFNDFENTEPLKRTTSTTRQEDEVKVVSVASASVVKAPKKFIPYPFQVSL